MKVVCDTFIVSAGGGPVCAEYGVLGVREWNCLADRSVEGFGVLKETGREIQILGFLT
jgi:hypothetical protein